VRQRVARLTQRVHSLQIDVIKLTEVHERYTSAARRSRGPRRNRAQEVEAAQMRAESEAKFERLDIELAELQARIEDHPD
jgi:chromosome segregation protein